MEVTYAEGRGLAVVAPGAVVVLVEPASTELALAVAARLHDGGGLGRVLGAIAAAGGLDDLPDFAAVALKPEGAAIAVHGDVTVTVSTAEGSRLVDGLGVTSWREETIPGALALRIVPGGGVEGAQVLPIGAGVVRAGSLTIAISDVAVENPTLWVPTHTDAPQGPGHARWRAPLESFPAADEAERGAEALVATPESEPGSPAGPMPEPVSTSAPDSVLAPALAPEPVAVPGVEQRPEPEDERLLSRPVAEMTLVDVVPFDETVTEASVAPVPGPVVAATATDVPASPSGGYDHFWDATIARRVEDAAVREDEESDEGDDLNHDGLTIGPARLAEIRAQRAGASGSSAPATAPVGPAGGVLGRLCPSAHPNPPERGACRVCGSVITGDAVHVARPSLGRARLSTGASLELDGSMVLGRRPRLSRASGNDIPRLVTVASPNGEVSGTHLALRLEEWRVMAVDLESSNGTLVNRDGLPPQRLDPKLPWILRSGDVVDLGDGVLLTFEDLP